MSHTSQLSEEVLSSSLHCLPSVKSVKESRSSKDGHNTIPHLHKLPIPVVSPTPVMEYHLPSTSTKDFTTVSSTKGGQSSSHFGAPRTGPFSASPASAPGSLGVENQNISLTGSIGATKGGPSEKNTTSSDLLHHAAPLPSQSRKKQEQPSLFRGPPTNQVASSSTVSLEAVVAQRTIAEQQRVIQNLQDLLQSTKEKVGYMEEQNRALRQKQYEASPLLAEELEMLRHNNTTLVQQTALLMDEKSWLEKRLESSHIAFKDLSDRLQKQEKIAVERTKSEKDQQHHLSLLRIAETERKLLKIENTEFQKDLDRCDFEKKRWRALVQTLVAHLPSQLNKHVEKHVRTMVKEEEHRFQESAAERKARQESLFREGTQQSSSMNRDLQLIFARNDEEACANPSEMDATSSINAAHEIEMVWRRPTPVIKVKTDGVRRGTNCNEYPPIILGGNIQAAAPPRSRLHTSSHVTASSALAASESRGTLVAVPFRHTPGSPPRLPGSVALGLYTEDSCLP